MAPTTLRSSPSKEILSEILTVWTLFLMWTWGRGRIVKTCRSVFRPSRISTMKLVCRDSWQLLAVRYCLKKVSSQMFDWILNTLLTWQISIKKTSSTAFFLPWGQFCQFSSLWSNPLYRKYTKSLHNLSGLRKEKLFSEGKYNVFKKSSNTVIWRIFSRKLQVFVL